jgi:hypothetical protein
MNRFVLIPVLAILMATPAAEPGRAQTVQNRLLPPPTSPQSNWDSRLPQPPTPSGLVPNTSFQWPFEVLPYYYQPPVGLSSPYARYLQSFDWNAPYYITPMPNIPSYYVPPYQEWPNDLPLH